MPARPNPNLGFLTRERFDLHPRGTGGLAVPPQVLRTSPSVQPHPDEFGSAPPGKQFAAFSRFHGPQGTFAEQSSAPQARMFEKANIATPWGRVRLRVHSRSALRNWTRRSAASTGLAVPRRKYLLEG